MDFQSNLPTVSNKPPAELKAPMAQMYERGQQFLWAGMLSDAHRKEDPDTRVTKPETRRMRIMKAKQKITHAFPDEQKERARQALGLPSADNHSTLGNASGFPICWPTQPPTPSPGWGQDSGRYMEQLPNQPSISCLGQAPVVDPTAINNTIGLADIATQGTMRLLHMEQDSLQQDIQAPHVYAWGEQDSGQCNYQLQQQLAEKQEWRRMLEVHTESSFQRVQYYRSSLESPQPIPEVVTQCGPTPSTDGCECEAATENRMDVD